MTYAYDMVSCVERRAAQAPAALAIRTATASTTYGELSERARRVAGALHDAGIGSGHRVGFLGKNCEEYAEVLLGVAMVGAIMVGINWRLEPPEIAWILEDTEPKLLIASESAYGLAREAVSSGGGAQAVLRVGGDGSEDDPYRAWRDAAAPFVRPSPPAPEDIVALVYTSGTTGRPKGAPVTHRALNAVFNNMQTAPAPYWSTGPDAPFLITFPMFNIGGYQSLYAAWRQGCPVIIREDYRAPDVIKAVTEDGVAFIGVAPTMLQTLLEDPSIATGDFRGLKYIAYGSAPMPPSLVGKAMSVFGEHIQFSQGYGMTEHCGMAAMLGPADHDNSGNPRMRSVGRPLDGVQVKVADPSGKTLPPGEIGEVCLKSESLMTGYWNNPAATASAFRDGWYRTGDVAYLDADGYIYLQDRLHDVIISGGSNIYPAEVEGALASHPAVQEVAVAGVPDEKWGESPRAFVVLKAGHAFDEAAMIAHLEGQIARYKFPRSLRVLDSLPKTSSGKVLRRALKQTA